MAANIQDMVEQLGRAAMAADPADLPGLADIHAQLEVLAQAATGEPSRFGGERLPQAVQDMKALTERLILRETDDAAKAITRLHGAVTELQQLVDGAGTTHPEAAPSATTSLPDANAAGAPVGSPAGSTISEEDAPLVAEFISEANGHIESSEAELLKLDAHPDDTDAINAVFRGFHTIKGVAGFLNLQQIGALAHAAENLLDLARKGQLEITGTTLDLVLESSDVMKRMLAALDHAVKNHAAIPQESGLDQLVARLHAAARGQSMPAPVTPATPASAAAAPTAIAASAPALPAVARPEASAAGATDTPARTHTDAGDATVKVATDRLDKLINAVGELVIAHAMAGQDITRIAASDQRFLRNMTHLGKITRELQDLSMAMRMVPIQGVFQKMTRLVRDLGRKAGKNIELHLQGGETELDRNVVEAISDPLVHMVRNAADHGIEDAADRLKAGKPAAGRIELKVRHQAGHIVIEITDDGKGLNKAKILRKARDAGIVREGQELSEQDIFRLIFHAGLSTAEKLTDVSGRGVGMDVVRKNVEALRGQIDIASVEGRGSTFTIRLPLTLAVIDGLIVKVGTERFIIPITSIEQSLRPRGEQLSTIQGRGEMCLVRDRLLPVVRLHRLFHIPPTQEDPAQALFVIVHDNQRRCCLLVDELLGQQQVVIKSLGRTLGQVPGTSGGAIMGDGCVSLILDIPGIIELTTQAESHLTDGDTR